MHMKIAGLGTFTLYADGILLRHISIRTQLIGGKNDNTEKTGKRI